MKRYAKNFKCLRGIFIDRDWRGGRGIDVERLSPADALVMLLANGFAELGTRKVWLELLELGRDLARTVPMSRAQCPDSLESLAAAGRNGF